MVFTVEEILLTMAIIITHAVHDPLQDGAKLCARLLSNEDTVMLLAQQMVAMSQYYQFDGWLVNIENPINVRFLIYVCICKGSTSSYL